MTKEVSTAANPYQYDAPFGWGFFLGGPVWASDAIHIVRKREELLSAQMGVINSLGYQQPRYLSVYSQKVPTSVSYAFYDKAATALIAGVIECTVPTSLAAFRSGVRKLSETSSAWFSLARDFETVMLDSIEIGHAISELRKTFRIREITKTTQDIELSIVDKYKGVKEIRAIYTQKYRREFQITVLLKIARYKDELMDRLLDLEYQLHEKYREPYLAISYIPGDFRDIRDVVHPGAKLIFER